LVWPASGPVTKLYQNSGGANPAFSDVGAVLTDVQVSSVAWGDYDNDGDLDILIRARTSTSHRSRNSTGTTAGPIPPSPTSAPRWTTSSNPLWPGGTTTMTATSTS
jgi:hypothetical protein